MSRLIYVPQFPVSMRYNSWWITEFTKEFKKQYDEVVVLGFDWLLRNGIKGQYNTKMFSPINDAIHFETVQMNDYMNLNIRDDDTLFLADISFTGLFCNVLYHKPCPKMFAFCHATCLNKYDYFAPMRKYKKKIEYEHARLFDGIFFGSQYSSDKPAWYRRDINCHVVYLPEPPIDLIKPVRQNNIRPIDIVSVCRPSIQKVNKKLEKKVERALGIKIYRQDVETWNDYNILLGNSKILLISTKEDTFNYTLMDAIRCGCIPFAPDDLCFPEILPPYWRYESAEDLIPKLVDILDNGNKLIPALLCQKVLMIFLRM